MPLLPLLLALGLTPAHADMATLPPPPWMLKLTCAQIQTKMNAEMVGTPNGGIEQNPEILQYNGALKAKKCDKYVYKAAPPSQNKAECAQLGKDILSLPTTSGTAQQRQTRSKLMSEWNANKCPGYPGQAD